MKGQRALALLVVPCRGLRTPSAQAVQEPAMGAGRRALSCSLLRCRAIPCCKARQAVSPTRARAAQVSHTQVLPPSSTPGRARECSRSRTRANFVRSELIHRDDPPREHVRDGWMGCAGAARTEKAPRREERSVNSGDLQIQDSGRRENVDAKRSKEDQAAPRRPSRSHPLSHLLPPGSEGSIRLREPNHVERRRPG